MKLLERTTRRVRLTESGRYLLEEAIAILARAEAAENTVRLLASGTKAILRVGYTRRRPCAGARRRPRVPALQSRGQARVDLPDLAGPARSHSRGRIDLGFIQGHFQSSEIESRLVARHRLVALLPPDHPLAAKAEITIADLAAESLVMGTSAEWPTFRRVLDTFQRAGHVLSVAQEASSLIGILGLGHTRGCLHPPDGDGEARLRLACRQ